MMRARRNSCATWLPRLTNRIQMTTDGLKLYVNAIDGAFAGDIDYAMLTKLYGPSGNDKSAETRYLPGRIKGTEPSVIFGDPARLDQLRGTRQPDHAHVDASVHAVDERVQQEV